MGVHQSSTTDEIETARRDFLARVEALLPATGVAWTLIEYQSLRPFGCVGLVLTALGMPGAANVIAISLSSKRAIDYAYFPGGLISCSSKMRTIISQNNASPMIPKPSLPPGRYG
jgi:hypothetical protein